jgi:alkanesulfonate monooxygenase SsuD/methylene tetrahydromethanopterin reductase-like flavin-dependent oxidoreductase (luciferase family)
VHAVRSDRIPPGRLTLGIGAGGTRQGALAMMADAAARLRAEIGARVLLGALGPRMRRLAAEAADGALLSWLTPEIAAEQAARAHRANADAHVALYVRTAVDPAASDRLAVEVDRYGSAPAYAANFARLGITAAETVLAPGALERRLGAYRDAVDEVVLRAIPVDDTVDAHLRFIDEVAEILPLAR